jgi:hypothetical protein
VDKNSDLEYIIGIQMDKLDFELVEQAMKEITGGEPKSPLEKGFWAYDFVGIWCRDIFTLSRPPFENDAGRKKMVIDQLEDLAFINGGFFEHFWARCSHGGVKRVLREGSAREKRNGVGGS